MRWLAALAWTSLLGVAVVAAQAQHGGGVHAGVSGMHGGGHAGVGGMHGGGHAGAGGMRGGGFAGASGRGTSFGPGRPAFGPGSSFSGPGRPAFGPGQISVGPGRLSVGPGRAVLGPVQPFRSSPYNRGAYPGSGARSGVRRGYPSPFRPGGASYGGHVPGGTHPGVPLHGGWNRGPFRRPGLGLRFFYPGAVYPAFVDFGFLNPYWDYADLYGYDQTADSTQLQGYSYDPYGPAGDPGDSNSYTEPSANPYMPPRSADPYGAYSQSEAGQQSADDEPMVYAPYLYGQPAGGYPQQQPQVTVVTLPPPQREEDAVTIFYRDGRAPEQIRNYALTRTSLLITGDRMREIPLQDLDLPLTERVNRAAGVEFRLPQVH